jgi:hypothetical protein
MSAALELASKEYSDGRTAVVIPLLFGRARIAIGPTGSMGFDDLW